jgi:RNA polymerase sigma-70 factor (ECF subfamily)
LEQTLDFKALYEKYAPDVFRFATYLSGNRSDAEDITAETFVRAWTASAPIELATVKGYLFTIARNLFLKGLRRTSRQTILSDEIADPPPGAPSRLEQRAELDAVLTRLQTLPDVDRAALLMRAMEGLPYQEIATALEISVAAAKVKVHRARAVLMKLRAPSGSKASAMGRSMSGSAATNSMRNPGASLKVFKASSGESGGAGGIFSRATRSG